MTDPRSDPGAAPDLPDGPLYVPVRPEHGYFVTCFFRTPSGRRTAVAFTTSVRLLAALGRDHPWIRLSAAALRSLTAPLGCALTVDPRSTARPLRPPRAAAPPRRPRKDARPRR
ncbi:MULTISPECIES: SAV_915 family protein [Streptomyces]|uniref:SAV_915 family protein n=1 Tax=Streptomyces heliomycini TaxID=284032 RepID=A0ABV5LLR9_9ACTN|nr:MULTISPECIES: SAV_915 family protein [Streptomyces]